MASAGDNPSPRALINFLSLILRGLFFDFLVLDVATNLSFHIITPVSTRIVTVIISVSAWYYYNGNIYAKTRYLFIKFSSVLIFSKKELAKYNKPYNPTVYPYWNNPRLFLPFRPRNGAFLFAYLSQLYWSDRRWPRQGEGVLTQRIASDANTWKAQVISSYPSWSISYPTLPR